MSAAPQRFTPPPARFRARLSAWVLVALALATGAAETLHLTLADHHAFDVCRQDAAPTTAATLQAPHTHGCGDHHTLADHETRDLAQSSPQHTTPPAVFQAAAAATPPRRGSRLGRGEQALPVAAPLLTRHLIRGPPANHDC